MLTPISDTYHILLRDIGDTLENGRVRAYQAANTFLVQTYWHIGRHIVEYEQQGNEKAEYGTYLFDRLARDLRDRYGEIFSRSSLIYIRKLYLLYPIGESLIHQLTWTHYIELLKIEDSIERSFYEKQTVLERWSVRELKRQKKTSLFQRLALGRNKKEILRLAAEGNKPDTPANLVRDPYVLEFLGLSDLHLHSESELENLLISKLQYFLLELGKGFAFIGRQYRITFDNRHYRVDLVFYHRILKCFVLVDLKTGRLDHGDVGQMNMYLNYFRKEENMADDNEPVGIILTAEKDEVLAEYALGGLTNQIFVSKYQFYLPDKRELEAQILAVLDTAEHEKDNDAFESPSTG